MNSDGFRWVQKIIQNIIHNIIQNVMHNIMHNIIQNVMHNLIQNAMHNLIRKERKTTHETEAPPLSRAHNRRDERDEAKGATKKGGPIWGISSP